MNYKNLFFHSISYRRSRLQFVQHFYIKIVFYFHRQNAATVSRQRGIWSLEKKLTVSPQKRFSKSQDADQENK